MELNEFVTAFAEEFEDTPIEKFEANTRFRELEEWSSLSALSIIAIVDEHFNKQITGADLRSVNTIEELYNFVQSK
jgi:acyl carrier protein